MLYLLTYCVFIIAVIVLNKYVFKAKWDKAANWIIAISAIATVIISIHYFEEQVSEMEKSRRFEWRPFLDISHISKKDKIIWAKLRNKRDASATDNFIIKQYASPEKSSVTGVDDFLKKVSDKPNSIRDVRDISLKDSLFSHVDSILIPSFRVVQYKNLGSTPLRIKNSYISILTEDEWVKDYQKSAEKLVSDIPNRVEYSGEWEIDYIVKSKESRNSVEYPHLKAIPISELYKYCAIDSTMTIYWTTSFEYEDFFGHKYNTLLMEYEILRIYLIENHFEFGSIKAGIEKYRWDVGID